MQYLREAYDSYDAMRDGGFAAGAGHALATDAPQGSLHGFLALLVFSVAGASRNAALSINIFAFLAIQASMFAAVRRISGSWALAWAAVGLLAAFHSPWSGGAGSATDFRLDWMAACAYGVALAAAVSGNGFRSTRWAVIFGVAVGVAILMRHLTAVYFGFIYAVLAAWLLFRPDCWRRCGRLALSGICAVGMSAWAFWRNWRAIYDYYWVTRFVGPERSLRDSHMSLAPYVRWMGSELLFQQLGLAAALLCMAAGAVFLYFSLTDVKWDPRSPALEGRSRGAWPVVIAFLAAPVSVLLVHPEKAAAPLNIMIPALAWAIVLVWIRLARRARPGAVAATCAMVVCAGGALFAGAQLRDPNGAAMAAEYASVNALGDFLYFRSEEAGLSQPRVGVNWVLDSLGAGPLEIVGRERHGRFLHFVATLPTGLLAADPGDVMSRLAGSDFVCLVTRAQANWPFDRQMEAMLPGVRTWCDTNLRRDGGLETEQFSASIYERRDLGRPPGAKGVDLGAMLAASSESRADTSPVPPAPPLFIDRGTILWTTRAELRYELKSAYSPVRYRADSLPGGLEMDAATGEIRGWFRQAGDFSAGITAENAAGSSAARMAFRVTDDAWGAEVDAPERSLAGVPTEIKFLAFDTDGTLDFIDVSDRTTGKGIERLAAREGERRNWQGAFSLGFRAAGPHVVVLRFVRFDPRPAAGYTYKDRSCTIEVSP